MERFEKLYYLESPFKDIPMIDPFHLQYVSEKFGLTRIEDFSPTGDSGEDDLPWNRVSQAVLMRDNFQCRVCERSEFSSVPTDQGYSKIHISLEVHHIVPRKDRGSDSFRNLITLCEECHKKTFKSDYGGVPHTGPLDLYYLDNMVYVYIPVEIDSRKHWLSAFLQNYHTDFSDRGYRILSPAKGARYLARIIQTDIKGFREIGDELRAYADANDFRTLVTQQVNGQKMKVRFFIDRDHRIIA
ncbi:MAG: HNH endonuclease [Thermoplasmataceae archaeon]